MSNLPVRAGSLLILAYASLFLMASSAKAQDGAGLYKEQCASCHGDDGKADNPVGKALSTRDLTTDDVQAETVAQMIDITTNGKNLMPAYKDKLTADQIASLVTYIRATFGKGGAAPAAAPAANLHADPKAPTYTAKR